MPNWTKHEIEELRKFARGSTPPETIARRLNRTTAAVKAKARQLRVSLKPDPNSPFARK
jgi:hypothetical protein